MLILDADLRNPLLSRKLVPKAEVGLLEVLAKQVAIEDALCLDPDTHLAFLPAVVNERLAHSSQLLASDEIKILFERLRQSAPPLEPGLGNEHASSDTDGVLRVTRDPSRE